MTRAAYELGLDARFSRHVAQLHLPQGAPSSMLPDIRWMDRTASRGIASDGVGDALVLEDGAAEGAGPA